MRRNVPVAGGELAVSGEPPRDRRKCVFTLPGRIGDNLARLLVAHRYASDHGPVDIALDHESGPSLIPLLSKMFWVDRVYTSPGITYYGCGGGPIDFGRSDWNDLYEEVYHLGYAQMGSNNINLMEWSCPENYQKPRGNWYVDNFPLEMRWDRHGSQDNPPVFSARSTRRLWDLFCYRTYLKSVRGNADATKIDDLPFYECARAICAAPYTITTYSAIAQLAALVHAPLVVLIPEGGTGLNHFDQKIEFYPGWTTADQNDPQSLLAAIEYVRQRAAERGY